MGRKKYRVAMLIGCAQDLIFSDINRDTVEVLARNGCEVVTPPKQLCCGSLHAHNGEWDLAQQLARKQIDQFPPDQFDAIITNAGGCGSHLKHYHKLLADDPAYRDRAALWDKKVKDIHEWLMEIGIQPPGQPCPGAGGHLSRVLPPGARPEDHWPSRANPAAPIPNLKLVELPESLWCCGSAGIYNIVQPEMADQLLDRKLKHIKSTGAASWPTATRAACSSSSTAPSSGMKLRVVHPITLLAEAYRGPQTHANQS